LEMYKRWQDRVFPHCEFDVFINKVEALSGTNRMKHELQEMRTGILRVAQEAVHEREREVQEREAQEREQQQAAVVVVPAAAHVLGGDDDDDLDLDLALDDDDERMEMMMMIPGAAPASNDDDDLDLDLLPTQQDRDDGMVEMNDDDDGRQGEVPMTMMATQDILAAAFAGLEEYNDGENDNGGEADDDGDEVILDDEELLAMAMAEIQD
jgi:hypothetical protein